MPKVKSGRVCEVSVVIRDVRLQVKVVAVAVVV